MKRTDIERMISLVDDRYIDEIFQDKITGKRRNIFVTFAAVAAALAVVAGGIGYLVSNAGNADKITADDPIVSEFGIVDYSLYFQNYDESAVEVEGDGGVLSEATGISCYFSDSEYVKSVMPFDISGFANAECRFAYDYKDEVRGIMMHADNRTEGNQKNVKMLDVEVYEQGELFPHLSLGKCKSMKRFDVDVYGFDFREEDNTLGVIFAMDGKEYLIGGNSMSYDEIGLIMDSIIENGLWAERFDLSKAEMEYGDISANITLGEANFIEPFAGHVPQIHKFGDMTLNFNKVSYSAGRDEANGIVPQWLYFTYYDGGEQDICLQYFTDDANVQPLEKTVAIDDIDLSKLSEFRDDGNNHTFTIDFGNFKVNVWTNNCNDNELLNCIIAMRIGANGIEGYSSRKISLIEANNIVPFAGYVPQTDNIGGMHLVSAYCIESSFNGAAEDNTITFKYLQEETGKYITLNYTCEYADPFAYYAGSFTAEELKSLEQQSELGDPNCRNYIFSLDCGDFRINIEADCTPEEMEQCISEITNNKSGFNFTPFGTLLEANKLEPFAGYVPTVGEIGDLKIYTGDGSEVMIAETEEYGRVLHICYQSEVTTSGGVYGGYDFKAISTKYTEKKAYNITEAPVISAEQLLSVKLDDLKTDGIRQDGRVCYRFIIDYGTCYISVAADCLPEEMRDYLMYYLEKEFDVIHITRASAKDVEPFGVYVPEKENSVLGNEFGRLEFYGDTPSGLYFVFSNHDNNNRFYLYYRRDNIYFSAMPAENIIPIENIDWSTVDNFVKNNTTFLLDCGNVKIEVDADCTTEQAWFYIEQIKNSAMFNTAKEDGKILTIDKVKELAKKGDDLTWSDFDGYTFTEGGSGLYIKSYSVEGGYNLMIGGSGRETKPMYINLSDGNGNLIDIRYDSVDDFLTGD